MCGVFMGYDKPKPLGAGETGGRVSAPIARAFFAEALKGTPPVPFRVPPGIKLVAVSHKTGVKAAPGDTDVIMEAFKPGTAPPDSYNVVDYDNGEFANAKKVTPEQEKGLQPGGLY